MWTPYLITLYSTLTFDCIVNYRHVFNIIILKLAIYQQMHYLGHLERFNFTQEIT
jgi:hypothetical protein